jgi:CBS domain containing-hemolysin-like protein
VIIHDGDLDRASGFVHAKDLLRLAHGTWPSTQVGALVRPLEVTPEHHRLEDLLVEMQTERFHISLVVDEHGTVVGLVSMEDVIEELIGDFDDESDVGAEYEELGDGAYRVQGTLRPEQFTDLTGIDVPEGEWHTLAGFAVAAFDEIPETGDRVATAIGEIEVELMDGYAIDTMVIRTGQRLVAVTADEDATDRAVGRHD